MGAMDEVRKQRRFKVRLDNSTRVAGCYVWGYEECVYRHLTQDEAWNCVTVLHLCHERRVVHTGRL